MKVSTAGTHADAYANVVYEDNRVYYNGEAPETGMLVHIGRDRTHQWTLVLLEQPPEMK